MAHLCDCEYKKQARMALISYSMVSFAFGCFVGAACIGSWSIFSGNLSQDCSTLPCLNTSPEL